MDKNKPLRIRYEYVQDKNLRMNYAHGVWGGINPHGEIEMNFYTESDKLPPFSECQLRPDGTLGAESMPYDENVKLVSREINSKILLNYHTARAVLDWLEEKLEMLEDEGQGQWIGDDHGLAQ